MISAPYLKVFVPKQGKLINTSFSMYSFKTTKQGKLIKTILQKHLKINNIVNKTRANLPSNKKS